MLGEFWDIIGKNWKVKIQINVNKTTGNACFYVVYLC